MRGGITNLFLVVAMLVRWGSGDYRRYNLVQHDLCNRRFALLGKNSFRLKPDTSMILEQTWNSSSFLQHSDCEFYLETPWNMGLYLIIPKLQLRHDAHGNCMDIVEVKQSNDKKTQFCFTPDDDEPHSFTDNWGSVRVSILLNSYALLPETSDNLDVQIIATVKRSCNAERVRPCEIGDDRSCISEHFFGDRTINCPSCTDENGCSLDTSTVGWIFLREVGLKAIILLVPVVILCAYCSWCLYQQCVMCGCSQSVPIENMELYTFSDDVRPTAPPIEQKDEPPSYNSLNPATFR